MQISLRTLVVGALLAVSAGAVRAQASAPAATTPSSALNLTLRPATPRPNPPVDLLQSASAEVKRVARWVIDSGDNAGLPFLLIDKVNAQVLAFSPAGQLRGTAPVLLGMARGDRMLAPNEAPMSEMPPEVRITPAGRFGAYLAMDSLGKQLLVLDYAASLSLHAVVKGTPEERRAERLNSVTSDDNRISFGCINVPTAFYATVVSPTFTNTRGVVYILPEMTPAAQLFGFRPSAGAPISLTHPGSTALIAPARQANSARTPR